MRFYFDFLSHNEEIRDYEGVELSDWLTAHDHAFQIVTPHTFRRARTGADCEYRCGMSAAGMC